MTTQFKPNPKKTYASEANAIKAVTDTFGDAPIRFMVVRNDAGRYFPVLLGIDCLQYGAQFTGFTIVG